ncbi:MAG: hypothetical protein EOP55_17045, partial [Sphingobacteriales bacterium]
MVFSSEQGRFGFSVSSSEKSTVAQSQNEIFQTKFTIYNHRKTSFFLLSLVAAFHIIVIFSILTGDLTRHNRDYDEPLKLIQLRPEPKQKTLDLTLPSLRLEMINPQFVIPDSTSGVRVIEFVNTDFSGLPSEDDYELPNENSELYKDVFDPRLRKKLQDNHQVVSKAKSAKLRTWADVTGNTVV